MQALYQNFFALFGMPRKLHSDGANNFEGKLFQEICKMAGITKSKTTPYHPRDNGQTERMNRTILQMLRTCANGHENWPEQLPTLLAAYRMTVHSTTKMTPNYAMFGREVLLPASLIAKPPEEPHELTVPFAQQLRTNIRQNHERIRAATMHAAKTQKTYFDKQVRGPQFPLNQFVYLFLPRPSARQKARKLFRSWDGPYRIISFKTKVVVRIQHRKTNKMQTVHVDRLTPCYKPDMEMSPDETQTQNTEEHQSPTVPNSPSTEITRPRRRITTPARLRD